MMMLSRRGVISGIGALGVAGAAQAQPQATFKVRVPAGSLYHSNIADRTWSFSTPAPNTYRFEIRTGDQGWIEIGRAHV